MKHTENGVVILFLGGVLIAFVFFLAFVFTSQLKSKLRKKRNRPNIKTSETSIFARRLDIVIFEYFPKDSNNESITRIKDSLVRSFKLFEEAIVEGERYIQYWRKIDKKNIQKCIKRENNLKSHIPILEYNEVVKKSTGKSRFLQTIKSLYNGIVLRAERYYIQCKDIEKHKIKDLMLCHSNLEA
eukprot:GHVP01060471.1.p1 GENE.GHVP01060471.1~~GHVP01060471.1.p1  ORF type:complete len:185 (+),score=31.12 GHVP01060471.1:196-750(+)